MAPISTPRRHNTPSNEPALLHEDATLTVSVLLPTPKRGMPPSLSQHAFKQKQHDVIMDALSMSNEERQQQGGRMRGVVASTPLGTHGSEWLSRVAVALPRSAPSAGGVDGAYSHSSLLASDAASSAASSRASSTSLAVLGLSSSSSISQAKSRSLPAVASAPSLRRMGSAGASSRFSGKHRVPDTLTPRTLLAAEERLLGYLASREEAQAAPPTKSSASADPAAEDGPSASLIDASMLSNSSLRDFWDAPASPLPKTPRPTVVAKNVVPVSDADALNVLREVRACAGLTDRDLLRLLHAGTRKLVPKYAVPMRINSVGDSFYVVLRGRFEILPSRLELQNVARVAATGFRAPPKSSDYTVIAGPSMIFGELSILKPVPRERTAIALDTSELLVVSSAALRQLGTKAVDILRGQLKAEVAAKAQISLPFFDTLPVLTQRQVSPLFDIEYFKGQEYICRQGDPGDKMYIVLWGKCEVWRAQQRGWDRHMIASYTGCSALPWFGEVFQWVDGHGRAGDVICTEDTMTLSLHRDRLAEFVFYAPGFKALTMSAASAFTVKSVRVQRRSGEETQVTLWDGNQNSRPLRFAVQWARMISKLLGVETEAQKMKNIASVKVQQVRRRNVNSMDWVTELIEDEARLVLFQEDEDDIERRRFRNEILEGERRKVLEAASKTTYGDTRSLVTIASGRGWRTTEDCWNVRTEMLRAAALSGELQEERSAIPLKKPRLPDTFPPRAPLPKAKDQRRSRLEGLFHESHIKAVDYSEVEYVGPGPIPTPASIAAAPAPAPEAAPVLTPRANPFD